MVGIASEPHEGGARTATAGPLALAPFGVALALLLISLWSDGAFALRYWGPVAVFVLACLVFGRTYAPASRAVAVLVVAVWAFAGWSLLSALWADSPARALEGGARNLLYAALVSLPLLTLPDRESALRAARATCVGLALLVAATMIALLFSGADWFLAGRLDDPVEYRNATAALFAIAYWPLLSVAAHRDVQPLLRSAAFSLAVMALGLALLTQSRGVLVGFSCGAVVALAFGPDRMRRAWLTLFAVAFVAIASGGLLEPYDRFVETGATDADAIDGALVTLVSVGVAAFCSALVLALLDGGIRVSERGARTVGAASLAALALLSAGALTTAVVAAGNPVTLISDKYEEFKQLDVAAPGETRFGSTGGQRYDLWRIALDDLRSRPVNGAGEGSYQTSYYAQRRTDRNVSTPHSVVFATLAELGAVGFILLVAIPAAAFAALAGGWRAASQAQRRWGSALAAAGSVLLGQAAIDWLWRIPGLTGLGLLCLAVGVACVRAPRAGLATPGPRGWRVASIVVPLIAIALVATLYVADAFTRAARAERGVSTAAQLDNARTAQSLNPFVLEPRYLEAGALEAGGDRALARRVLLDALELEPRNFVTMALIGDLETRAGERAAARDWYRRALALNPADVGLRQLASGAAQ